MKAADRAFVEALRRDEDSGATAIVARTARLLAGGGRDPAALLELAEACRAAQPAMAGLLTIITIVRAGAEPEAALGRLVERLQRAPASIARHAAELLRLGLEPGPGGRPALAIVTCSASAAVEATVSHLAKRVDVTVSCAESRPRREGAALARRLADAGLDIRLFTDAGISSAIPGSDALVIGADAVGPDAFVNKVGSAALCALANSAGVPVYVLVGREKILTANEFERLSGPDRPAPGPPSVFPVTLRLENPTFERVQRHLVSQIITDAGAVN
ncbi:MAG: hypothetical protein ABIX28_14600 [Vicinamibacterales bacterium]